MTPSRALPPSWSWASFKEVATVASNLVDPAKHQDLPHIAPNHIESRTGRLLPHTTVAEDGVTSSKHLFHRGQILYSKIRPYLAKVVEVQFDGLCSADMYPINTTIVPRFLFYWLLTPEFTQFASHVQGRTVLPKINRDQLDALPVPVAPLREQERIVAAIEEQFSRLDAGATALERVRKNLKLMRASMLEAAVTGRLVQTDHDAEPAANIIREIKMRRKSVSGMGGSGVVLRDFPVLPHGWCWTTIGELFDVFVGFTPSRSKTDLWAGDIPWVSSGEVAFGRIRTTREHISETAIGNRATRLHPPGTVMLAMIGEGRTRGQAAILDVEAAHNQNCASIRVSATPVLPEYVYWILVERYERTRTMASGGVQPALNSERVKAIPLPLPPVETQKAIVAEIERQETLLSATSQVLDAIASRSMALRSSTLATAFSGRLSFQDPTDEPASVLLNRIAVERAQSNSHSPSQARKSRARREQVTA